MNSLWNTLTGILKPTVVNKQEQEQKDYKVADMALAEWGHKEIAIAEHEMPGIVAVLKEYEGQWPL